MNLLTDPIFRTLNQDGETKLSLPELLADLGRDRPLGLPGVQRHQGDIFHIFLCYLAGAVLSRSGLSDPVQEAEFWRGGLRDLAGNEDSAWTLVVEDPTRPAFMQPPSSSRKAYLKDFKADNPKNARALTPVELDVILTSRNHDIKKSKGASDDPEAWACALICLQTASGFLGAGNYGVARMNGGFGSRICVGWQENRRPGARFRRDLGILLQLRPRLLEEPYLYQDQGRVLLWLDPWDGTAAFPLSALDPFFVEISRRIRLTEEKTGLLAFSAPTKSARVDGAEFKGNVGDPWTPVNLVKNSALTLSKSGFTPRLLRDLLFSDQYQPAPMQVPLDREGAGWFCASVLVRGQGTTDGFHEAAVRVPEKARLALFGAGAERERLAELSKSGLELAGQVERKALRPAVYAWLQGGPENVNWGQAEVGSWVDAFSASFPDQWKNEYFRWLWEALDEPDDQTALRKWFESLRKQARQALETAFSRLPRRQGREYRALVRAENFFHGGLKKNFPQYFEEVKQ